MCNHRHTNTRCRHTLGWLGHPEQQACEERAAVVHRVSKKGGDYSVPAPTYWNGGGAQSAIVVTHANMEAWVRSRKVRRRLIHALQGVTDDDRGSTGLRSVHRLLDKRAVAPREEHSGVCGEWRKWATTVRGRGLHKCKGGRRRLR